MIMSDNRPRVRHEKNLKLVVKLVEKYAGPIPHEWRMQVVQYLKRCFIKPTGGFYRKPNRKNIRKVLKDIPDLPPDNLSQYVMDRLETLIGPLPLYSYQEVVEFVDRLFPKNRWKVTPSDELILFIFSFMPHPDKTLKQACMKGKRMTAHLKDAANSIYKSKVYIFRLESDNLSSNLKVIGHKDEVEKFKEIFCKIHPIESYYVAFSKCEYLANDFVDINVSHKNYCD
jgi:hypothetical protein